MRNSNSFVKKHGEKTTGLLKLIDCMKMKNNVFLRKGKNYEICSSVIDVFEENSAVAEKSKIA